jgi:hypothetical protein
MAVYNTFYRLFINRLGLSIDGKKRVAGYKICNNFIPAIFFLLNDMKLFVNL